MNLHLIEMLTNNSFHMSERKYLNDPFDSGFKITLDDYLKLYKERYPSLLTTKEQYESATFLFNANMENGEIDWARGIEHDKSIKKITCFTENYANPLMWAHYAQNHTGVCLNFCTAKDENFKNSLQPVNYLEELIEIKCITDFEKSLLTKLHPWSIEKEWRIISSKEKFHFKRDALVEIIFGLKVKDDTISWFKGVLEGVFYMHTSIKKLRIKHSKIYILNEYDEIMQPLK
ncbi:MAG: DUF2971 domain-containing protein [Bacteroidales bacterium]|nr:DUF2971 domain-containing protein [Bacteroidales bacterium]